MTIYNFITLIGGLAFFLYGMHVMSTSLTKLTGGKLERVLKTMTSSTLRSLALGAGVTAAIQSSSALTVMLVGLVNSGIFTLRQSIGIIMGSNIGTTITAWILSLTGIEGDSFFIKFMKPDNFSLVFAFVGMVMIMNSKKTKHNDIGEVLVAFAILMYGMKLMSSSVSTLADMPEFANALLLFSNPVLGVIAGALFTAVIQSSSASVGILQAFALTGVVSYGTAIPIIMGQNIGTCVTALISSMGVNTNAKRVAAVHISFNVIGTLICLTVFYSLHFLLNFAFINEAIGITDIAICHTVFNLCTTAILCPFTKQLETLACRLVPDRGDDKAIMIDERLLTSPSFAVSECNDKVIDMANIAKTTVLSSIDLLNNYDLALAEEILAEEKLLDEYEDTLGTYLVKLSGKALSTDDSHCVSKCLHTIGDLERIGDHARNLVEVVQEMNDKRIIFSDGALEDIIVINHAVTEVLTMAVETVVTSNLELAKRVEPLEDVIDELIDEAKSRHIARLQQSDCTIELGFVFSDYLTNMERISDHCSNIAVCQLELASATFGTHNYIFNVKDQPEFKEAFAAYRKKYKSL